MKTYLGYLLLKFYAKLSGRSGGIPCLLKWGHLSRKSLLDTVRDSRQKCDKTSYQPSIFITALTVLLITVLPLTSRPKVLHFTLYCSAIGRSPLLCLPSGNCCSRKYASVASWYRMFSVRRNFWRFTRSDKARPGITDGPKLEAEVVWTAWGW